jgi:hypothetical protein
MSSSYKEGCSIKKQAELLKVKFGSAWPGKKQRNCFYWIERKSQKNFFEKTCQNNSCKGS